MAQELATSKIKRSIKHKTPSATDHVYEPGDSVLVRRERIVNNRIGEFIGSFTVRAFDPLSKPCCCRSKQYLETTYHSAYSSLHIGARRFTRLNYRVEHARNIKRG